MTFSRIIKKINEIFEQDLLSTTTTTGDYIKGHDRQKLMEWLA